MSFGNVEFKKPDLIKISDYIWEIPKTFKQGMNVPARIYGSKAIVDGMDNHVYDQITNVATLPGILKYAYCMADGHSGYGFPIGGVAAMDAETGVISPGGIGFDINCLSGDSRILTKDGTKSIEDFEDENEQIFTLNREALELTTPAAFMKFKKEKALVVKTELGNSIVATADHPFLTSNGMKVLGKLKTGDLVQIIDEDNNKLIFDRLEQIKELDFNDFVYDFTIPKTHNFIANNFVVSNCGMRLITTNLTFKDVQPKLKELVDLLFQKVPAGVGSKGFVKLNKDEFKKAIETGSNWCVEKGYGWQEDLERTEFNGCFEGADSSKVSSKAIERGIDQIGTLGSGNHYLEIQHVKPENLIDERLAKKWGLFPDQIVIMFHCGSRGFGHQVATDYLQLFLSVMESKYGIKILDRELACAPFRSKEGQDYFTAMKCGVNMSFANRQTIVHRIRESFSKVFGKDAESLGMHQVYDIAHNRASVEKHKIDGSWKEVVVHRKGATAAFGPGREEITSKYREDGQPIIIGGSMETGSYLLVGTETGAETFYTTAHGSGRTMSRTKAKGLFKGDELQKDMMKRGIYVKSVSYAGLAEEAGAAYKDIDEVINSSHNAGISKKVAKLIPIGNVKG